jgi:hypothetical protein
VEPANATSPDRRFLPPIRRSASLLMAMAFVASGCGASETKEPRPSPLPGAVDGGRLSASASHRSVSDHPPALSRPAPPKASHPPRRSCESARVPQNSPTSVAGWIGIGGPGGDSTGDRTGDSENLLLRLGLLRRLVLRRLGLRRLRLLRGRLGLHHVPPSTRLAVSYSEWRWSVHDPLSGTSSSLTASGRSVTGRTVSEGSAPGSGDSRLE